MDLKSMLMNKKEKSIDIVSGFMFLKQTCLKLRLKPMNRFDLNKLKWDYPIFYPKKCENVPYRVGF